MTGAGELLRRAGLGPWWRGRSPRERALVLGMVAAFGVYLLVAGLAQPMLAARAAALEAIAGRDAALARLAALPEGPAAPAAASSGRPVTAVVTDTAPEFGLTILRIEPEGAGARLTVGDAGFAEVLSWIAALERDHGLRLTAIEMDRRPEPGVVSARLTIER